MFFRVSVPVPVLATTKTALPASVRVGLGGFVRKNATQNPELFKDIFTTVFGTLAYIFDAQKIRAYTVQ